MKSREQIAIEAPSPEQIFDIAAPYFAWNAESWHKATQGTIGMPGILNYTRAILESVTPPAQGSIDTPYGYATERDGKAVAFNTQKPELRKYDLDTGCTLVPLFKHAARIAPAPVDAGDLPPLPETTLTAKVAGYTVKVYGVQHMCAYVLADRAASQSAAPVDVVAPASIQQQAKAEQQGE